MYGRRHVRETVLRRRESKAESLIGSSNTGFILSPAARETLIDAVTQDLSVASDQAMLAEQRTGKLETQTRVLAEAVTAISDHKRARSYWRLKL